MEMTGAHDIPAPRERVWIMLNDPQVLRECIPGCSNLSGSAEEGFAATVRIKLGPVKITFNGEVELSDIRPPESYKISGEGKGGVAGFAKGSSLVTLTETDTGTLLNYVVDAQIGGKLAQIGARLIDSTSKKLANQFFEKFVACCAQIDAGEGPSNE